MPYFVFCGDSNTHETYVPRVSNYAYRFCVELGQIYVNRAVYGQYAIGAADAVTTQVLSYDPKNVMCMIGTNDAANAHQNSIPLTQAVEAYRTSMHRWIGTCRAGGRRVFVVAPPLSRVTAVNIILRAYRDMLLSLTTDHGVQFFDVPRKMDSHGGALFDTWFITSDLYHLSAIGHAYILDMLSKSQALRA